MLFFYAAHCFAPARKMLIFLNPIKIIIPLKKTVIVYIGAHRKSYVKNTLLKNIPGKKRKQ